MPWPYAEACHAKITHYLRALGCTLRPEVKSQIASETGAFMELRARRRPLLGLQERHHGAIHHGLRALDTGAGSSVCLTDNVEDTGNKGSRMTGCLLSMHARCSAPLEADPGGCTPQEQSCGAGAKTWKQIETAFVSALVSVSVLLLSFMHMQYAQCVACGEAQGLYVM